MNPSCYSVRKWRTQACFLKFKGREIVSLVIYKVHLAFNKQVILGENKKVIV